ncbi:hypothetical protein GH733_001475, partial [Mirounga leonina]
MYIQLQIAVHTQTHMFEEVVWAQLPTLCLTSRCPQACHLIPLFLIEQLSSEVPANPLCAANMDPSRKIFVYLSTPRFAFHFETLDSFTFEAHEGFYCSSQELHQGDTMTNMPFHANHVIPTTYCEHMAVVKMVCVATTVNRIYGLVVALLVAGLDISAIASSYVLIIQAVLRLSSKEAHHKAVNTCTTHICVMLIFYTPSLFSFLTHRFGRGIPPHVHTILGNLYFLVPPMLNPIIYAVKNKEFRDKLTKYGCWKKESITIAH